VQSRVRVNELDWNIIYPPQPATSHSPSHSGRHRHPLRLTCNTPLAAALTIHSTHSISCSTTPLHSPVSILSSLLLTNQSRNLLTQASRLSATLSSVAPGFCCSRYIMRSIRVKRASWIEADSVYFERSKVADARRASASSRVAVVQGRWRWGRARWKEPGGRRTTRSSKEVVGVGIVVVESLDDGLDEDCDCWDRWVCCPCCDCCDPMLPSQ